MPHVLSPLVRAPGEPWHLINDTRGSTLATRIETAFDSQARRQGLLGRRGMPLGDAIVIAPSNAIHTACMRFPIDVIFIDRRGTVLRTRPRLCPWRLAGAWGGFAVVELPSGVLAATGTLAGDRLAFVAAH